MKFDAITFAASLTEALDQQDAETARELVKSLPVRQKNQLRVACMRNPGEGLKVALGEFVRMNAKIEAPASQAPFLDRVATTLGRGGAKIRVAGSKSAHRLVSLKDQAVDTYRTGVEKGKQAYAEALDAENLAMFDETQPDA